jgi:hypothetical protein
LIIGVGAICSNIKIGSIRKHELSTHTLENLKDKLSKVKYFITSPFNDTNFYLTSLLAPKLTQLTHLELKGNVDILDNELLQFLIHCKNLKFLDLDGCASFTDLTLINVSKHSNNLTKLFIGHTNCATNTSLSHLFANMDKLNELDLSSCYLMENFEVFALLLPENINILYLNQNSVITYEDLVIMLEKRSRKLVIYLLDCILITKSEIFRLKSVFPFVEIYDNAVLWDNSKESVSDYIQYLVGIQA